MPSRYILREFGEDSIYHVFHRGIEGRDIFLDENDFKLFYYYLFVYLAPLDEVLTKYPSLPLDRHSKNISQEVELLAYCLMPNHYHLLLRQKPKDGVSRLMRQLSNGYTRYFNQKHSRVGNLFLGRFKAVRIQTEAQLLHVSRYIHLNPLVSRITEDLDNYSWSSYPQYLNSQIKTLCNKETVLSQFNSTKDYEKFVLDQAEYGKSLEVLKHLQIDAEVQPGQQVEPRYEES